MARYVPSGHLVYLDRGTLFAVAFDVADTRRARRGRADRARRGSVTSEFGFGHYDVSANGTSCTCAARGTALR